MGEQSHSWYVRGEGNRPAGPFTAEQILQSWQAGRLDAKTICWREGMSQWLPLGQIEPFASAIASTNVPRQATAAARSPAPCPGAPSSPRTGSGPGGRRRAPPQWIGWAIAGGIAAICALVAGVALLLNARTTVKPSGAADRRATVKDHKAVNEAVAQIGNAEASMPASQPSPTPSTQSASTSSFEPTKPALRKDDNLRRKGNDTARTEAGRKATTDAPVTHPLTHDLKIEVPQRPGDSGEPTVAGVKRPVDENPQPKGLSGTWRTSTGAEFRIRDDGKTANVDLSSSSLLKILTGKLTRSGDDSDSKTFKGVFDVVFVKPAQQFTIRVTAEIDDDDNRLTLKCENWPKWNSQGRLLGREPLTEVWTRSGGPRESPIRAPRPSASKTKA
jgi:hypothetical protein